MTPEEFHKTDLTGRKVVFRNPQNKKIPGTACKSFIQPE